MTDDDLIPNFIEFFLIMMVVVSTAIAQCFQYTNSTPATLFTSTLSKFENALIAATHL